MTVSRKKKIDNKIKQNKVQIEQNKAQYNLDRQTSKILAGGNVGKHEFLMGENVLPEKWQLEKAATVKRFKYLSLRSQLQKQTGIAID